MSQEKKATAWECEKHIIHAEGHHLNAMVKDATGGWIRADWLPGIGNNFGITGNNWSSDVDRKREEHHNDQFEKKGCSDILAKP